MNYNLISIYLFINLINNYAMRTKTKTSEDAKSQAEKEKKEDAP